MLFASTTAGTGVTARADLAHPWDLSVAAVYFLPRSRELENGQEGENEQKGGGGGDNGHFVELGSRVGVAGVVRMDVWVVNQGSKTHTHFSLYLLKNN